MNFLLRGWIQNLESDGSVMLHLLDDCQGSANYDVTKDLEFTREGSKRSATVQFHVLKFSIWNWLNSRFKPLFGGSTQ